MGSQQRLEAVSGHPSQKDQFRAIYRAELPHLYNTLKRLGVDPNDLEDLAHEVLMTAYQRLCTFDPARPIRPWLFGIAYRKVSDFRQKAHFRREVMGTTLESEDQAPSALSAVQARQDRELVLRALQVLELEPRAIFVMHEIDGYPIPQVATALEIPLNTAYSRLRTAREKFADAVRQLHSVGGSP